MRRACTPPRRCSVPRPTTRRSGRTLRLLLLSPQDPWRSSRRSDRVRRRPRARTQRSLTLRLRGARADVALLLRAPRHADDLPEDFSHRLGGKPRLARDGGHAADDGGLARRIENWQLGDTLQLGDALPKAQTAREQLDEIVVDRLDLLPALRQLLQRECFRWFRHATARPGVNDSRRRPAAAANAPSDRIICANAGGASD